MAALRSRTWHLLHQTLGSLDRNSACSYYCYLPRYYILRDCVLRAACCVRAIAIAIAAATTGAALSILGSQSFKTKFFLFSTLTTTVIHPIFTAVVALCNPVEERKREPEEQGSGIRIWNLLSLAGPECGLPSLTLQTFPPITHPRPVQRPCERKREGRDQRKRRRKKR